MRIVVTYLTSEDPAADLLLDRKIVAAAGVIPYRTSERSVANPVKATGDEGQWRNVPSLVNQRVHEFFVPAEESAEAAAIHAALDGVAGLTVQSIEDVPVAQGILPNRSGIGYGAGVEYRPETAVYPSHRRVVSPDRQSGSSQPVSMEHPPEPIVGAPLAAPVEPPAPVVEEGNPKSGEAQ